MVDVKDTITGIDYSYHLEPRVKKNFDRWKEDVIKKDTDKVVLVDGRERSGKSLLTFQFARYIDPSFCIDRICFTPSDFLRAIRDAKKGQVVVFDEAFRGLSSKSSISKINKSVVQAMMECGQRNLILFIVLPTFFLLETYAATLRSNDLVHVFVGRSGRRGYKVYSERLKAKLYHHGKKRGFDYSFPTTRMTGKFYNKWVINEQEYREKKNQALMDITDGKVDELVEDDTMFLMKAIKELKEKNKYTWKRIGEALGKDGHAIEMRYFRHSPLIL